MARAFEFEVTESYVGQLDIAIASIRDRQRSKFNPLSTTVYVGLVLQMCGWLLLLIICYITIFIPLSVINIFTRKRKHEKIRAQSVLAETAEGEASAPHGLEARVAALQVARFRGCRVIIWSDEHPPPHFHVEFQGEEASFSILTCDRLRGTTGLKRYEKQVRAWWKDNKPNLIQTWNATRPADCPVGPIIA